jgi:GTP cyclohydrolase I
MDKCILSWNDIGQRIAKFDIPGKKIYGVPNGGMIACILLRSAIPCTSPDEADIILDDVLDSGRTKSYYQREYPSKPFVALVDKQSEGLIGVWVSFPWERQHPSLQHDGIEENITRIIEYLGDDPNRDGLKETPKRVIIALKEMCSGYHQDLNEIVKTFDMEGYDEMVLLKDIEFYSLCEHHMLPFFGRAHVAYIPGDNGKVIGVSKLARIVDTFAKRLQIQERIGRQVVDFLQEKLQCIGAACIIEANHLCMRARGVEKQSSIMITSSLTGVFLEPTQKGIAARAELMSLIFGGRNAG